MTVYTPSGLRPSPRPRDAGAETPEETTREHVDLWGDGADTDSRRGDTDLDAVWASWRAPALGTDAYGGPGTEVGEPSRELPLLAGIDDGPPTGAHPPPTPPARSRSRAVPVLGAVCMLSVGFLGGLLTERQTAPAGTDTALTGEVESRTDGTLAVRGADGRVTALRTSAGTRVVTANPVAGELPAGTLVDVRTRRGGDGALEAVTVAVDPRSTGPR